MLQNANTHTGNKIKDLISNQEEKNFLFVEDPARKTLLRKAVAQIKEFRETEFSKYDLETMVDAVHDLYEAHKYVDRVNDYPRYLQLMLEAFARPEVNTVLAKHIPCFDSVLDFMGRLLDFTMRMDNEIFQTILLVYTIESCYDRYSDKELEELIETYAEKTRSAKTGKVKRLH